MKILQLEELIRLYTPLSERPSPTGWHTLSCLVCNDHKYKKRGGFKFDGNKVAYHCFNCGIRAVYDPADGKPFSQNMEKVLDASGIPKSEQNKVLFEDLKQKNGGKPPVAGKLKSDVLEPPEIELLPHFYLLGTRPDDIWSEIAEQYLLDRGIELNQQKFYLSEGGKSPADKAWKGRLIIPVYKKNKLIFYQGRDLTNKPRRIKYKSSSGKRDNVIYGYDELTKHGDNPIFVVEGYFDAQAIGGVAVFGNDMTEHQTLILNRSRRPKIVIPDRKGDGGILANQAIKMSWGVSFPDIGNCKDVSEACNKYGSLFVIKSIMDNVKHGFDAQVATELLCEKSNKQTKKEKK